MGERAEACCENASCHVESVLNIDERGQMVLPKDLRNRAGIGPGDRIAVVSHEMNGEVCCITLIKAERLDGPVRGVLGPVMSELVSAKETG